MTVATDQPAGATAIRTYRVDIPEEALEDLHRRIAATRWPDMETVDDGSQGTPLGPQIRGFFEPR